MNPRNNKHFDLEAFENTVVSVVSMFNIRFAHYIATSLYCDIIILRHHSI